MDEKFNCVHNSNNNIHLVSFNMMISMVFYTTNTNHPHKNTHPALVSKETYFECTALSSGSSIRRKTCFNLHKALCRYCCEMHFTCMYIQDVHIHHGTPCTISVAYLNNKR